MENQEPISLEAVCDLLDCAARAADLVLHEKSDWCFRDRAMPLLRILVEQEVEQFGPLDSQGRTHKQRQALGKKA